MPLRESLLKQLGGAEKEKFDIFAEVTTSKQKTKIFLFKPVLRTDGRSLLEKTEVPQDVTDSEWQYLLSQIRAQKTNITARNSITKGLIEMLANPESDVSHSLIIHEQLTIFTLNAIYNYLRVMYPHQFYISLWFPDKIEKPDNLVKKYSKYPKGEVSNGRTVNISERKFKIVQAYRSMKAVVSSGIHADRISEKWFDFDEMQPSNKRALNSAIQLPIYREKRSSDLSYMEKDVYGVLSIDTDKPYFFIHEEADLWLDELVGFLVNIALAEQIRRFNSKVVEK